MKRDLLLGMSPKWAIGVGVGCYLLSRLIESSSMLGVTIAAMFEISGLWLFFAGLYRWYKEVRAKKTQNISQENRI